MTLRCIIGFRKTVLSGILFDDPGIERVKWMFNRRLSKNNVLIKGSFFPSKFSPILRLGSHIADGLPKYD